jgi:hypothetical protein
MDMIKTIFEVVKEGLGDLDMERFNGHDYAPLGNMGVDFWLRFLGFLVQEAEY